MGESPKLLDRLGYGLVMLPVGLIVGAILGSLGYFVSTPRDFNYAVLALSTGLFVLVGLTARDRAGEFLADLLRGVIGLAGVYMDSGSAIRTAGEGGSRLWMTILVVWFALVIYALFW